jgi:uncharacterized protein YqjF (DUF2071 family)
MKNSSTPVFLTAEWHHLAMLNYEVDSKILASFIPSGTELYSWNDKAFVSVVGFLFQKTRVYGITIPFHRNFEEVNLRFYVRRKTDDGWRRAVIFIKELVPRLAIALTARTLYNENYISLPMSHQIEKDSAQSKEIKSAAYFWRFRENESYLKLTTRGNAQPLIEGSEQEFITEHYWGYSVQRDGSILEYRVEHPRWRVWDTQTAELHCDIAALYGKRFCDTLNQSPSSAFLAEGSEIKVYKDVRLNYE